MALGLVKAELIIDESDLNSGNDENARLCRLFYPATKEEVLRSHPWNRSTAFKTLQQDATAPVVKWSYRYALPAKCLRVFTVNELDPPNDTTHYWEVGTDSGDGIYVMSDEPTAIISYAFDQEEGRLDALCVLGIYYLLASKLAYPLVGNAKLGESYMSAYVAHIGKMARSVDAMEASAQPQNSRKRSKWVRSRRVSTNG